MYVGKHRSAREAVVAPTAGSTSATASEPTGASGAGVQVHILPYLTADIWRRKDLDRPTCSRWAFVGAAARDVGAPPRVCAVADLLYESYINLAPPSRLYAAAVGRGSDPLSGMETTIAHFVRVHAARRPHLVT